MSEMILSICISTYNRCDKCIRLVQSISVLKDSRYNIVVCDDASSDGTVEELQKLACENLIIKRNKKNVGPCKNWYNTINSGTAKYVLHVLDRDILDISQLQNLLNLLEKYNISGGYIGISVIETSKENRTDQKAFLYHRGKEAFLFMGGVPIHPTGFIVRRQLWEQCQSKKYFYQTKKYGIYPHSYVMALMALRGDMLYIPAKFYFYKYIGKNRKSRFYQFYRVKNEFWWMPENVLETAVKLLFYSYPYADKSYQRDFIVRRFRDGLYRATELYRETISNKTEMDHYGMSVRSASDVEVLVIGIWYYCSFMIIVNRLYGDNYHKLKPTLRESWKETMSVVWKMRK